MDYLLIAILWTNALLVVGLMLVFEMRKLLRQILTANRRVQDEVRNVEVRSEVSTDQARVLANEVSIVDRHV